MALPPPPPPLDLVTAAKRTNRSMFFLGAACTVTAARFFLAPGELERTSVGRALPGLWDEAWSACFLIGGLLIMAGVGFRRPRLELPGITLAATATVANGVAIFVTNGGRALSQLPLYVLALWVFDGRARDLRDLPRERRSAYKGDSRPPDSRVERRAMVAGPAGVALLLADPPADANTLTTLIVAVLGGGIVTAVVQALLYKPQRRDLEARLSDTAVSAAQKALDQAERRADALEEELEEARVRITELEQKVATLQASLSD